MAAKGEEDWFEPSMLVEVPQKNEVSVRETKGFMLPKGFGANGLLVSLLDCPKTNWDLNELLDDCPKAVDNNIIN